MLEDLSSLRQSRQGQPPTRWLHCCRLHVGASRKQPNLPDPELKLAGVGGAGYGPAAGRAMGAVSGAGYVMGQRRGRLWVLCRGRGSSYKYICSVKSNWNCNNILIANVYIMIQV